MNFNQNRIVDLLMIALSMTNASTAFPDGDGDHHDASHQLNIHADSILDFALDLLQVPPDVTGHNILGFCRDSFFSEFYNLPRDCTRFHVEKFVQKIFDEFAVKAYRTTVTSSNISC